MRAPLLAAVLMAVAPLMHAQAAADAAVQDVGLLKSPVSSDQVVFSKNGSVAVAHGADGMLRVWRPPAQDAAVTINMGKRSLVGWALSDDGASLAVGDREGSYTIWNTSTGAAQCELKTGFYPAALMFDATGRRLAVAGVNQPVRIVETASGRTLTELPLRPGGATSVAFSPDGTRLATADSDTALGIYDAATGKQIAKYDGLLLEALAITFSRDGKQVLAGGGDQMLVVLDSATGKLVRQSGRLSDPIAGIEPLPDGKTAALFLIHAVNLEQPVPLRIVDTESTKEVRQWMPPQGVMGGYWSGTHLVVARAGQGGIQLSRAW